jgi:hypothetical protein
MKMDISTLGFASFILVYPALPGQSPHIGADLTGGFSE